MNIITTGMVYSISVNEFQIVRVHTIDSDYFHSLTHYSLLLLSLFLVAALSSLLEAKTCCSRIFWQRLECSFITCPLKEFTFGTPIIQILICMFGADINAPTSRNGKTPLHWAVEYNHPSVVRWAFVPLLPW